MYMKFLSFTIVICIFMGCIKMSQCSHSCTQYQQSSQTYYHITYYSAAFGCSSWWSTNCLYKSASRTSSYNVYHVTQVCCDGYGGDSCEPICSTPCGEKKECTAPQTCTCEEGWTGSNCQTDINECVEGTDQCQYHDSCVNIAGSYNCNCPSPGDKLGLDGLNCIKPVVDFQYTPNKRSIMLKWKYFLNTTVNGSYMIDCMKEDSSIIPPLPTHHFSYTVERDVEELIVEPVAPFTNYTCSIKPVTLNGVGNPTNVYVQVLEDKPDGPPEDLTVDTVDSMILKISWSPPKIPNGVIKYYKIYVNFTNLTKLQNFNVDAEYKIFFLEFLNPFQLVGVSISAATSAGEGPATPFVFNRTSEAKPGRVHDMQVVVLSVSSAMVTWHPPRSLNGIVLSYHVGLARISSKGKHLLKSWELEANEELSAQVFTLEAYVPYEFTVVAATRIGKGEITPYKFYTLENVPKARPLLIKASRLSATTAIAEWTSLTDNELRGFFANYSIKYYTSAVFNDCSSPMDGKIATTVDEYVILDDLNPHSAYCVKVAASTTIGPGNFTSFVYINMYENSLFELHLLGVHNCKHYVIYGNTIKLYDIADVLTTVCNYYCRCGVRHDYFGSMRFQCDSKNNSKVIVQGSVIGTPSYPSYSLIEDLEQWKNSSPIIVVEGLQLHVDSRCDITLEDFGTHSHCDIPPEPVVHKQTTTIDLKTSHTPYLEVTNDFSSTNDNSVMEYIAIAFSMLIIVLIVLISIVSIIAILIRVKHPKWSSNRVDMVRYDVSTSSITDSNLHGQDEDIFEKSHFAKLDDTDSLNKPAEDIVEQNSHTNNQLQSSD